MWAYRLTAPETFERCEVRTPRPADLGPGQVLLETTAGGVCGSDLPFFRGAASPDAAGARAVFGDPGFPLHEVTGRVLAATDPGFAAGEHVVGWASRFDGLAERVVTAGSGLHRYRPGPEPATAVLLQPLACVLYAFEQVIRPVAGRHVAVLGLGPIGLLFAHLARLAGAARVTGVDRVDRSDLAATFGLHETVHAAADQWADGLADRDRPEVVIEAVGHQTATLGHAVEACAAGGEIFYFGVADDTSYPFPMRTFLRKNLTLRSGVTLERRRVLAAADEHLAAYPFLAEGYVTDVYPVDDVRRAFDRAVRPARGQVKVALTVPPG